MAPALPVELEYIWLWFLQLSRKRQSGMGVNPISSMEVRAWAARQEIRLTPFENMVIDRIDDLYVHHQNKKDSP